MVFIYLTRCKDTTGCNEDKSKKSFFIAQNRHILQIFIYNICNLINYIY